MDEIKSNDEIVCTDNSGRENELTMNKVYTVLGTDYSDFQIDGAFLVSIKNDQGDVLDYGGIRFKINLNMNRYHFIMKGNTVYWRDPEGISDGEYEVISVPEEIEDESIILIASETSEAEVLPTELRPV